jgi:predicted metal-dependent RNase
VTEQQAEAVAGALHEAGARVARGAVSRLAFVRVADAGGVDRIPSGCRLVETPSPEWYVALKDRPAAPARRVR